MNLATKSVTNAPELAALKVVSGRMRDVFESAVKARLRALRSEDLSKMCDQTDLTAQAAALWFHRSVALRMLHLRGVSPASPFPEIQERVTLLHGLFGDRHGWESLVLPREPLASHEPLQTFFSEFPDELFQEGGELIGWLYQFYSQPSRKQYQISGVGVSELGPATQLYTPLWLSNLLAERALGKVLQDRPVDAVRVLDPACGAGHLLLAAYRMLRVAYREAGYSAREIPMAIFQNNLFGVDIDSFAVELAKVALLVEACEDDPDILYKAPTLNIMGFASEKDVSLVRTAVSEKCCQISSPSTGQVISTFLEFGSQAARFGTLPKPPKFDQPESVVMRDLMDTLQERPEQEIWNRLSRQLEVMTGEYNCILANPPYLSSRFMDAEMRRFGRKNYPDSRADLYAMFIERCISLLAKDGRAGFLTMHGWMFLPSFEKMRRKVLRELQLFDCYHLGARAFESISGEVVQTVAFVFGHNKEAVQPIRFFDLREGTVSQKRTMLANDNLPSHTRFPSDFEDLPRAALSYWITSSVQNLFRSSKVLSDCANIRQGVATGDNDRFLRRWFEVPKESICFDATSFDLLGDDSARWYPYNKGGKALRWYGNHDFVIDLSPESRKALASSGNCLPSRENYFRPGITWSLLSSEGIRVRGLPAGFVSDVNGMTVCPNVDEGEAINELLLAYLSSQVCSELLSVINPTLAIQAGDMKALPVPSAIFSMDRARVGDLVRQAVALAKERWDEQELSWEFSCIPLLNPRIWKTSLQRTFESYLRYHTDREGKLQKLEVQIDKLFCAICETEFSAELKAVRSLDPRSVAVNLISFIIGTALGRYGDSKVTVPIVLLSETGGVGEPAVQIVTSYLRKWWPQGEEAAQLGFLGERLGCSSTADVQTALSKYLQKQFYRDHCRLYKKRPIYWKLSSGPYGAFECILPMHELGTDLLARVRQNWVVPIREIVARSDSTQPDLPVVKRFGRSKVLCELDRFISALECCDAIEQGLDLHAGVAKNYSKLESILAPIQV